MIGLYCKDTGEWTPTSTDINGRKTESAAVTLRCHYYGADRLKASAQGRDFDSGVTGVVYLKASDAAGIKAGDFFQMKTIAGVSVSDRKHVVSGVNFGSNWGGAKSVEITL